MTGGPSPNQGADGPMTVTVRVDRLPIDDATNLLSIDTWSAVNSVPRARLEISDGDPVIGEFEIVSRESFAPGRRLSIGAGYSGAGTTSLFAGVITKVGIEASDERGPRFFLEAADDALKMTLESKTETHAGITDGDLITRLITRNGLEPTVAATIGTPAEILQSSISDWDLMLARAEANGLSVIVEAGGVTVAALDPESEPVLGVTYGQDLLDLRIEMDASRALIGDGSKGPAETRGHVRFQGSGLAKSGRTIALAGLGTRFKDKATITGVRQTIRPDSGWITTADLSL